MNRKLMVPMVQMKEYQKNLILDYLLKRIKYFQVTKNVYVCGHTNAGKSSLINKLIKNYSDSKQELTISPLPSTTLNLINIKKIYNGGRYD